MALLAMGALTACGGEREEEGATRLGCGVVAPNLLLRCLYGPTPPRVIEQSDQEARDLEAQRQMAAELALVCDLERTEDTGPGEGTRIELRASCHEGSPVAGTFVHRVSLIADARRQCGFGLHGTEVSTRPVWSLPLHLDESRALHRVELKTKAYLARSGCKVSVGGRTADRIGLDYTRIFMDHLPPGDYELVIDCSGTDGLARVGCFGYDPAAEASPRTLHHTLELEAKVGG